MVRGSGSMGVPPLAGSGELSLLEVLRWLAHPSSNYGIAVSNIAVKNDQKQIPSLNHLWERQSHPKRNKTGIA